MGSSTRDDEVCYRILSKLCLISNNLAQEWAYESREFLRGLVVGKAVTFTITHSVSATDDVPRDIGHAQVNGLDLASELLKNGWVKVKELKREPTEEDQRKRDLEAEAKSQGAGIHNAHGPKVCILLVQA